jgi:hypothetical protein
MLAALGTTRLGSKFWGRYTLVHAHMSAVKKQEAYENRKFGHKNMFRTVRLLTLGTTRFLKRKGKRVFFKTKSSAKGVRLGAVSTRQKALLWKQAILKRSWGLRYLPLQFKFNKKSAQQGSFKGGISSSKKWAKRAWLLHKLDQITYESQIMDLNIEQLELLQQSLRARLQCSKIFGAALLNHKLAVVTKRLTTLTAPVPWWKKKKKTGFRKGAANRKRVYAQRKNRVATTKPPLASRALNKWGKRRKIKHIDYFGQEWGPPQQHLEGSNPQRLVWVPWYKLPSRRFLTVNVLGAWGGADRGILAHRFTRINQRSRNKWRTGMYFFAQARKSNLDRAQRANTRVALKTRLGTDQQWLAYLQEGGQEGGLKKPLFFSLKKAVRALDFNKFFKTNKVAARAVNNISFNLYSQYLSNLNAGIAAVSEIADQQNVTNARAARALRKYLKLLKQYFNEVHDNKVAKKIPSSSAMHWIREYLRLTGSIKRRASLWNRFNRVSFHFRPKAKDDDKRGRKKKILFKAKILFDRLFNWLYAQPNARYALAAPIQNGVVREYIVRNQFIFKKGFKVKLTGN